MKRIGLDQRWAAGYLDVADLTTAFEIRRYPVQTDQLEDTGHIQFPWQPPAFPPLGASTLPRYAVVNEFNDQSARPDGALEFVFVFTLLTFDMYKYIVDTNFSGGYSAPASIYTYSEFGDPMYVHCVARRPLNADAFKMGIGGYRDFPFSFVAGVDVTPA